MYLCLINTIEYLLFFLHQKTVKTVMTSKRTSLFDNTNIFQRTDTEIINTLDINNNTTEFESFLSNLPRRVFFTRNYCVELVTRMLLMLC